MTFLLGIIAVPDAAHAAEPPPSFAGEELLAFTTGPEIDVVCHEDGSGSVTWQVAGTAFGPYPGTYTETGSMTFGSYIDEAGQSKTVTYQSNFRIDSPAGIVHGDTAGSLDDAISRDEGYCKRELVSRPGEFITTWFTDFAWDVTITTADSVYAQSGTGIGSGRELWNQGSGSVAENFPWADTEEPVFVAPRTPTSAEQCKDNGYVQYGIFKNQGDCVAFVETSGGNEPGQNAPGK